jgi:hypothetical protein
MGKGKIAVPVFEDPMRSFRLAFRTFMAVATFTVLPLVAIADPPVSTTPAADAPAESRAATPPKDAAAPPQDAAAPPQDAAASPPAAPSKGIDVPATDNPQVIKLNEETVELTLPKTYSIKKTELQGRAEYAFSAPRNADGTVAGVMFFVIPMDPKGEIPDTKVVLDMMMKPGQSNLKDFQQQVGEAAVVNGLTFENAGYSGFVPDGKPIKGFFYVARVKTGFLIFTGRDRGDLYKDSEAILRGIVLSCKVR